MMQNILFKNAHLPYFIQIVYKTFIVVILTIFSFHLQASDKVYLLTEEQWNVPRSVNSVLSMPALQSLMLEFNKQPGSQLRIHYPGGDEGTVWATELKSWLVALGVESEKITLFSGTDHAGALEIQIIPPTMN